MHKKALYKHKRTGDMFAVETDEAGNVIATAGPLLFDDLNPGEKQIFSTNAAGDTVQAFIRLLNDLFLDSL